MKVFFESEENADKLFRCQYISRALGHQGIPDFVWKNFGTEDFNQVQKFIQKMQYSLIIIIRVSKREYFVIVLSLGQWPIISLCYVMH